MPSLSVVSNSDGTPGFHSAGIITIADFCALQYRYRTRLDWALEVVFFSRHL